MDLELSQYVRDFLALDCSSVSDYEAFISKHHPGIAALAKRKSITNESAFKLATKNLAALENGDGDGDDDFDFRAA